MNPRRLIRIFPRIADETIVLATFAALRAGAFDDLDDPRAKLVLEAIRRSTSELGPEASVEEIAAYVNRYDGDSLEGLAANIKGIYHELRFEQIEDTDGDQWTFNLYPETNHPASDGILRNVETGEEFDIQLKAGVSTEGIERHFELYDVPVWATSEIAEAAGVHDTGITNAELDQDVHHTLAELRDPTTLLDVFPPISTVSVALQAAPVVKEWALGKIPREIAIHRIAQITGWKVAKVGAMLAALAIFPIPASVLILGVMMAKLIREV